MEKRLVIAVALSIFIIVSFQYLFGKPVSQTQPVAMPGAAPVTEAKKAQAQEPGIGLSATTDERSAEEELVAETDRYTLTFSNTGASLKKILLKDYDAPGRDEPLCVVSIEDPRDYIFAISDPTNAAHLDLSSYKAARDSNTITYRATFKDFEVEKKYILHKDKYSIELEVSIKNISGGNKEFIDRIVGGAGMGEYDPADMRFLEVISKVDGKVFNFKRPKTSEIVNQGIVSWTALKNKYFSVIMKPFVATKSQFYEVSKHTYLVTGIEAAATAIAPGETIKQKYLLYVGPSDTAHLKSFGMEFEESLNYGFFGGISKVLIASMKLIYAMVHSWGLAVILLSLLLNLILSPLTFKSFSSMQKMQEIHPEMEKLKAQHKGNPQKLNKEIMELYKKYKINPLSGCLPMLLQMPIFIALYNALIRSIELRGASFLWIKDLSLPDAVGIPMTLPLIGNNIHILPLIMVVGMVVQQKISTKVMGSAVTEEQKQQQRMMLIIMPIMFGFIFYNMPSGLVLYWIINTFMTIVEQGFIFRKA